ncbi:hypothetical protein PR003_g4815 [Phytophthora rubi]|nr:hypothetical protein PR003_g4815 [Phytophthora rubi]
MPGAFSGKDANQMEPITIHRVDSSVAILRTKTKPKSLELIGSDGKIYKYLLKAREDLRLDERIMQFLRVTNEFLGADGAAASRDLSAESYNVIPLSRNAGLIQMVPDVVPLFQVYTSRNEQLANAGRAPQDLTASSSSAQQQPPLPTAQFYAKLKQHGIANVSPNHRAQWPVPVLKQVYQELVAQRPRNVLQQEILLRSEDLRESWVKNARLSKSVAVMSVLGYIVGLGDRHLDNILLCVNSGDIVHIDHNVCFDKGRRLKVPEVVPFRLTPMLQDALGFTGVEGRFRVAFETTLRVVRSDDVREALLTLFEAFVYSPLVDWIADDKRQGRSGDLKARLEVNVNLSLFLSRAEERRQDTISFGRQYEQLADIFSRLFNGASVSFVALLEQRKHLVTLASEEQELLKAVVSGEAELTTYQATEQAKQAEVEMATNQAKEIVGKLTTFANECWGRHQQIEVWRQESVNFGETGPEARIHAVVMAAESASFQKVHATISGVLERSRFADQQTEMLAVLEPKCRSVDTDVARLRLEIERLAGCLVPYLSAYSDWRKELDAYLDIDLKVAGKDVYFTWWSRCTQCLHGLEGGRTEESVDTTAACTAPSDESIAESNMVLKRLNGLRPDGEFYSEEPSISSGLKNSSFLRIDKLLQDIWMSLSAIKLSNAQGQRLLKLAGASWMIKTMDKLNGASSPMPSKATTLSTALKENQMFQFVVAVSHASMTLLDLVSTPKGSMKRLRANELMVGGYQTQREANQEANEGLRLFVEILQAMELFTMSFKEEIVLNLHRRGIDEGLEEELLDMIQGKIATAAGVLEVIDAIISPTTTDGDLILKTSLSHHQATLNMFAAAVDVIQKTSSYVDALRRTAVVGDERAKDIKNSARSNWIQLTLILIRRLTVDCETEEGVTELWSAHVRSFISDCQVELLQCQFSSIISHDWKFGFTALAGDIDKSDGVGLGSFMKQWDVFFSTHLADILPSTSINLPNGTPESQTGEVCNSVMDLMNACETWWSRRWRGTQSQSWVEKISSLRNRHERRIRYATWLATQPMHQTQLAEVPNLTRIQLLTVLSSQVPYLNALLTQQATIEASVLELAQQLDYFASSLHVDDTSNDEHSASESLHACVQNCYSKLTALFEYGRALADLVQGISVIETSTGEHLPETGKIELEVDAVGRSVLQSASKSTLDPHASNKALHEINARVKALEDELKHRQASYAALVSRKRAAEIEFLGVCVENKDAVMETAQTLSKRVKEMRLLLKRFDKFKTPSKQNQAPSSMGSDNLGRPRQLQSEERATTGFCFMENDRLVKILLRSIRSVDHLQLLESVLEKHGETCTSLREAVTQLDQVLREYDAKADALLTASDHNPQDPSRASLLLQLTIDLIEALRVVEPPSGPARPVTADDTSTSLLVVARDLVRGCVKLFFEATEMADRLSSAEDEISRASGIASLPEDEAAEEQVESADDSAPLALESENSVTLPVSGDSGSSAHDTTASTPRSVEKKSQYGLQVLKRIEEKLSGTVTEMAQAPPVLTVEQQATWLIDEATKTDNLCVMYEGWTPWI